MQDKLASLLARHQGTTWRRRINGKYHAEASNWLKTGEALCGFKIDVGAFVHDHNRPAANLCKKCLKKDND